MLRRIVIAAALAGALAAPAAARDDQITQKTLLMPGVAYSREVEFTARGPVALNVVTAPKPDGSLYTLAPVLSNNAMVATDKLTAMEKAASADRTIVGINGDFFAPNPGTPSGILIRGGVLDGAPAVDRSSLGIAPDGTLTVDRVAFDGTWRGTGQRRPLDLNDPPVAGHTTLYTSDWGPSTPPEANVSEVPISGFPPSRPNRVLTGTAGSLVGQGQVPIPPGGAVLVARGNQAGHLAQEAPAGTTVEIRLTLTPDWSGMSDAIGGGPLLVRDGKPVFRANEAFGAAVLTARAPRSAVGQLKDGRIIFVAVDGGGAGYSVGMTNFELALALVRLGAQQAMALGSGSASALAFDGTLLGRPAAGAEQEISDALFLSYTGVYAPPPATDVVSPNGDGVDDTQTFTYKLVRPSQVTAVLVGPDKVARTLVSDSEQPGLHTLQWSGKNAAGAAEPEGSWRFTVTAADDQGRTTSADRLFDLNDTLGNVRASRGAVSFELTRAAKVTVTVENRAGVVLATALAKRLAAGTQQVRWRGHAAAYQVRVTADNAIGRVTLVTPLGARRR